MILPIVWLSINIFEMKWNITVVSNGIIFMGFISKVEKKTKQK